VLEEPRRFPGVMAPPWALRAAVPISGVCAACWRSVAQDLAHSHRAGGHSEWACVDHKWAVDELLTAPP